MVKGENSCPRDHEFESKCGIPDGSFLPFFCYVMIVLVFEKRSITYFKFRTMAKVS